MTIIRTLLLSLAGLLGACALPSQEGRPVSHALSGNQSQDTSLGKAIAPMIASHPGLSGIAPLSDALEAFSMRALLIRAAERSLDIQYYIWRDDITGNLLLDALQEAAERGVRVRLLLDDNGIPGLDQRLARLDTHPHVEVRLFNPFSWRRFKPLGYLTHFPRANRRMHNKSLTADSQVTVIGGRNIGDEYFGATEGTLFTDLDVVATGPVVGELASDFDRYWNSESAYPLDRLVRASQRTDSGTPAQDDPGRARYLKALQDSPFLEQLLAGQRELHWSPVRLVSDDPRKGQGLANEEDLLLFHVGNLIGTPGESLYLVSPYFVPTDTGVNAFRQLRRDGVDVQILTNALEATDVSAVHAGYAKHRAALLDAGVVLYEMRRQPTQAGDAKDSAGLFGSSASSLHAKTFAVDRQRLFVGSFNFDPRSAHLNTELGFIIDNPVLAEKLYDTFEQLIPQNAYQVGQAADGTLYWQERDSQGQARRHTQEPGVGPLKRLGVWLLSHLPIDSLL